jgi:hypothetical protein
MSARMRLLHPGNHLVLGDVRVDVFRHVAPMFAAIAGVASCSNNSGGVGGPPVAEAESGLKQADQVEVGTTYDYLLYDQCGVKWAKIGDNWWETTTPLDDGNGNSQQGWGNLFDSGKLTIIDETTARYTSSTGVTVRFERTNHIEAPFVCR